MTKTIKVKTKPVQVENRPQHYRESPLEEKTFFRVDDIVLLTGVGKNTVYEWFRRQDFPAIKVGQRHLVQREKFLSWFEKTFSISSSSDT